LGYRIDLLVRSDLFLKFKTRDVVQHNLQMKIIILLITFSLHLTLGFSIEFDEISKDKIPSSISVKGSFQSAFKWYDNNGTNYLILSSKGPFKTQNSETGGTELNKFIYTEQYIQKDGTTSLLWDIIDFEQNCPFDIDVQFIKNSIQITDLDKDGITETTIAYKKYCRSDITPAFLKILIHENSTKFALRGQMIWSHNPPQKNFEFNESKLTKEQKSELGFRVSEGRYKNLTDFNIAPDSFSTYAVNQWKLLCIEQ